MAEQRDTIFSGMWHLRHWYPSGDDTTEESDEYYMKAQQKGNKVVFESLPNGRESYMLVRLTIDGEVATGTWYENAAPQGAFKGVQYSGAGQLIVGNDKQYLKGMWAGVGMNHAREELQIYTGRWELRRAGSKSSDS